MRLALATLAILAALPAGAQEDRGLRFTLAGGAQYAPTYPGSGEYEVRPDVGFRFQSLSLGNRFAIGNSDFDAVPDGFSLRGAFNYEGERDADVSDRLTGLDDLDDAVELGLGAQYAGPGYRVFGEVRYGVTGHESFVGEVGADAVFEASDRLTLLAGPRATIGSSGYSDYYFGVSDAEAATAAGLGNEAITGAYEPSSGLVSAGIELGARYRLSDAWGVEGTVSYDRLESDAGDSPVVEDRDQYGVGIRLTRRFTLDF